MEPANDSAANAVANTAAYIASLLQHYSFDLGGYTIAQLLLDWQGHYPADWIRLATIEALYQGRYKAISVEQILALWLRRRQPLYHFNHEFERLVCNHLPQELVPPVRQPASVRSTAALDPTLSYHSAALQLPSFASSSALPESDTMLALRTLHSKAAADLDATKASATGDQPPLQTYSYRLRSPAQTAAPDSQATNESLAASDTESTLTPPEHDLDVCSETRDAVVQDRLPAPTSHPLDVEPKQPTASSDRPTPVSPIAPQTTQVDSITRILQQLDDQEAGTEAVLPGAGRITHTLKPKLRLHLTTRYQPLWLTDPASKQPIHQFTPEAKPSDFHSKLKAVAQPPETLDPANPQGPSSD